MIKNHPALSGNFEFGERHLDPAIGKFVDGYFLTQMLRKILAQRDLPFGGDSESAHDMHDVTDM